MNQINGLSTFAAARWMILPVGLNFVFAAFYALMLFVGFRAGGLGFVSDIGLVLVVLITTHIGTTLYISFKNRSERVLARFPNVVGLVAGILGIAVSSYFLFVIVGEERWTEGAIEILVIAMAIVMFCTNALTALSHGILCNTKLRTDAMAAYMIDVSPDTFSDILENHEQ